MANSKQRAENGQGSIRWINERECECMIQSQYLNPKTGKPKRFKRKQYFPVPLFQHQRLCHDMFDNFQQRF